MRELKIKFLFCLITACCVGLLSADLKESTQKKYSEELRQLIDKKLAENNILPNKAISEEVFLRRVYLDAIGRIPTLNESKEFLSSKDSQKRNKLIDRLLDSAGHTSHNYNYWADTLRATNRMRNVSGLPYISYIKKSIRENKPYDKFVREMLTANGAAYEHGNGQTGYYFRDANMPLDNMSNTMQVFLGTSMVCAQCHDHPFDRWTQMDFYKLAAFTSGTKASKNYGFNKKDPAVKPLLDLRMDAKEDRNLNNTAKQFTDVLYSSIEHTGTGLIRLPHDYDYDDAKPHDIIKAGVPYGKEVVINYPVQEEKKSSKKKKKKSVRVRKNMPTPGEDINSRETFAKWVTSRENPMFTKTIVNRMWERYMGAPLVGPLLSISTKNMGANKELTDALMKQMQAVNFDLKDFARIILKSKAYQRETNTEDVDAKAKNYFAGPMLRRLSAEQLWDSLISVALENPDDKLPKQDPLDTNTLVYKKYSDLKPAELASTIRSAAKDYKGFRKSLSTEARDMNMQMTMSSMGMDMNTMKAASSKMDNMKKTYKTLSNQAKKARKKGDKEKAKDLYAQLAELRDSMKKVQTDMSVKRNKTRREFVRASEVESPAKPSHFLRRFGQSERDIIDGASKEASIPQALTLLNGKVEDYLINNQYSFIARTLRDTDDVSKKIELAYLSVLTRKPTAKESSMLKQRFAKDAVQAQKDMIWVLVNSNEFMFNK